MDTPVDANVKLGVIKDSPMVDIGKYQRLMQINLSFTHTTGDWISRECY